MNELTLYSYDAAPMAVERKPRTGDYTISVFGGPRPHSAEAWILA